MIHSTRVIRYTPPSLIGYSGAKVLAAEHEKQSDIGNRELRQYLIRAYPSVGSIIELHDPEGLIEDYRRFTTVKVPFTRFDITYTGRSKKLERVLQEFKKHTLTDFPHLHLDPDLPRGLVNERSVVVEFCEKVIDYEGREWVMSVREATNFLARLVDYLDRNYLAP